MTPAEWRRARRDLQRDQRRELYALCEEGLTGRQIADRLGISERAVQYRAAKAGVRLGSGGGKTRRISCWGSARVHEIIGELSTEAGISHAAMTNRILEAVCHDKPSAKKFLGKAALAKRERQKPLS